MSVCVCGGEGEGRGETDRKAGRQVNRGEERQADMYEDREKVRVCMCVRDRERGGGGGERVSV